MDKSATAFSCPHYSAHLGYASSLVQQRLHIHIAQFDTIMGKFPCPYCTKVCKSKHGLIQHQNSSRTCKQAREAVDELNREETNNGSSSNVLLSYLVDPKGDGVGKHNAGLGQEDDDVGCEERLLKVQKLLVQELTGLVQDHQVELYLL